MDTPDLPLEFYRRLIESAVDIVSVMKVDGVILYESPSVQTVLGYERKELEGANIMSFIDPYDVSRVTSLIAEGLTSPEKTYTMELRFKHKDGSWRWLESSAHLMKLDSGEQVILVHSREVTQRVEKALELQRLQQAVNASSEAIFITDSAGTITYINDQFTKVYGYTSAEVVGRVTPRILKSGQLSADIYKDFWDTLLSKKSISGDFVNKTKDGTLLSVSGSANPILNEKGDIMGFVAVQRDITKDKEKQKETDREIALRRAIEQSMTSGIAVVDDSGKQVYVSQVFSDMVGWTTHELMGASPPFAYWRTEDLPAIEVAFSRVLKGDIPKDGFELRFCRKDGSTFDALVMVSPLKGDKDHIAGWVSVVTDITARKKNEWNIRKLSSAIDHSPVTFVITDQNGVIEYVNPSFSEISGFSKEEAIGQNARIVQSGKTPIQTYQDMWSTILKGSVWKGEFLNKKKNGDFYWESISISPITNSQGVVTNFIAVKQDITQQKKKEEEIASQKQELEKMNSLMVGRELKMIELKEALAKYKKEPGEEV